MKKTTIALSMKRLLKVLALSAVLTCALASTAFADTVVMYLKCPDGVTTEECIYKDANGETIGIKAKEGDVRPFSAPYAMYPDEGDGDGGCNFDWVPPWDDPQRLDTLFAKREGYPDLATLNPTTRTFKGCKDYLYGFSVTPNGAVGATPYDMVETFNNTGGSFDLPTLWVEIENVPPTAGDDYVDVDEDSQENHLSLYGNDTDPGGSYELKSYTDPPHGTVKPWSYTGVDLEYTPDPDFSGTDSFTYTIQDPSGATDTATVNIRVFQVNDAPSAEDDSYVMGKYGVGLRDLAPGVLGNDSDAESDPLTAVKLSDPSHGTVTLQPNGEFYYALKGSFVGTDSFTYKANDGKGDGNTATVTIKIDSPYTFGTQSVTPTEGATEVARDTGPAATFSQEMDPETLTASTVTLHELTRKKVKKRWRWTWVPVSARVSYDEETQTATLDPYPSDPSALLPAGKKYMATVTTGAKDAAGETFDQDPTKAGAQPKVWTFTTGGS